MTFSCRFLLTALAALSLISGCAVGDCQKKPSGAHCGIAVDDLGVGFTIVPRRLNIKGDMIKVSLGAKTNSDDVVALKQTGAADLNLGKLGDGIVSISGAMLKSGGFRPGRANLIIGQNSPVPVRLYLAPDYGGNPVAFMTGIYVPLWVGIVTNQTLVALNKDTMSGAPNVSWGEYSYKTMAQTLGYSAAFGADARAAVSLTQKFVGYPNTFISPNAVMLRRCTIGGNNCPDLIQTSSTAISEMAVNRKGTILGAILGSKLVAYFIEASFANDTSFTTITEAGNPTLVGTEDIDDDGLADFVVWDEMAMSIRVVRQSRVGGNPVFAVDSSLSGQLQAALKSDIPQKLFLADVDGDGYIDMLYSFETRITLLINQGPAQDGGFRFSRGDSFSVSSTGTGRLDSLSAADVDADGLATTDIAFAIQGGNKIGILINRSTY